MSWMSITDSRDRLGIIETAAAAAEYYDFSLQLSCFKHGSRDICLCVCVCVCVCVSEYIGEIKARIVFGRRVQRKRERKNPSTQNIQVKVLHRQTDRQLKVFTSSRFDFSYLPCDWLSSSLLILCWVETSFFLFPRNATNRRTDGRTGHVGNEDSFFLSFSPDPDKRVV